MKFLKIIQFISILLSFTILFQSCKVYHKQNVTINDAVLSEKSVKIISTTNENYFFYKLFIKDDNLYGVTKINSATAKKLDCNITRCTVDGKKAKINLDQNSIKEIYLKNEKLSKALTIVSPIVIVSGVIVIVYVVGSNSVSFDSMEF